MSCCKDSKEAKKDGSCGCGKHEHKEGDDCCKDEKDDKKEDDSDKE